MPPRQGKNQVRAVLSSIAAPPDSEGAGRVDLAGALDRVGAAITPAEGHGVLCGMLCSPGGADEAEPGPDTGAGGGDDGGAVDL